MSLRLRCSVAAAALSSSYAAIYTVNNVKGLWFTNARDPYKLLYQSLYSNAANQIDVRIE